MTKQTQSNKNHRPEVTFGDVKFISMRLSAADKVRVRDWMRGAGENWFTRLAEIVEGNYKLSLSYYFDGATYIASLTCREPKDPNHGLCLTARSGDAAEAMAMLVFKHDHFCNDNIWEADADDNTWG